VRDYPAGGYCRDPPDTQKARRTRIQSLRARTIGADRVIRRGTDPKIGVERAGCPRDRVDQRGGRTNRLIVCRPSLRPGYQKCHRGGVWILIIRDQNVDQKVAGLWARRNGEAKVGRRGQVSCHRSNRISCNSLWKEAQKCKTADWPFSGGRSRFTLKRCRAAGFMSGGPMCRSCLQRAKQSYRESPTIRSLPVAVGMPGQLLTSANAKSTSNTGNRRPYSPVFRPARPNHGLRISNVPYPARRLYRRRRRKPKPARPAPKRARLDGSGTLATVKAPLLAAVTKGEADG
jgi:hypothetical protein